MDQGDVVKMSKSHCINEKWFWSMLFITVIMLYALSQGINGVLLSTVTALLGGLGGFALHDAVESKKEDQP